MPRKPSTTQETETPAEGQTQEVSRDEAIRRSYTEATNLLREEYKDRFNELRAERAAALGHQWSPPLTGEAKAEDDLRKLIEAHPHLRDKILGEQAAVAEEG